MVEPYGLMTPSNEPIPLAGVMVEGDIVGRSAKVQIHQRFRNCEKTPVEAVYKFPLPEGAAVCGFKVSIDGKEIHGQVEEREEAFDRYDKALSEGHDAYLLDEDRPNIFTLSVGKLDAGAEALVEIDYVTILETEGEDLRFFLPTTISPRYIPESMPDEDGIPAGVAVNPPFAENVLYGLSLSVTVREAKLVESVESPSHPIRMERRGEDWLVSLASESVRMDRDFILKIRKGKSGSNSAWFFDQDGSRFLQLDFKLDLSDTSDDEKTPRNDVIFLIDCSGSMMGDSITEARRALGICLRSLAPGVRFNLVRFGSKFESFAPVPIPLSTESLDSALSYADEMDADLGGTEIRGPLEHIYRQIKKGGRNADVVLITDGEVGNEDELLRIADANRASGRLSTVGIGAGVNEFFIRGLSRAGAGCCEFIAPGERVEPKVLRIFGKLMTGMVKNLRFSWGGENALSAPAAPVVFPGTPATVFARIDSTEVPMDAVEISAVVNGRKVSRTVDLSEAKASEFIPVLWARERIRDLEESPAVGRGSSQRRGRKPGRDVEVIELSRKYGIISRSTSFVAVEVRSDRDAHGEATVLRRVPVNITVGWHGGHGVLQAPRLQRRGLFESRSVGIDSVAYSIRGRDVENEICDIRFSAKPIGTLPLRVRDRKRDLLMRILSLQQAEGGLMLDEATCEELEMDYGEIIAAAAMMKGCPGVDPRLILSTVLLLRVLDLRFSGRRDIWEALVEKSRRWLDQKYARTVPVLDGKRLEDWVDGYLKDIGGRP